MRSSKKTDNVPKVTELAKIRRNSVSPLPTPRPFSLLRRILSRPGHLLAAEGSFGKRKGDPQQNPRAPGSALDARQRARSAARGTTPPSPRGPGASPPAGNARLRAAGRRGARGPPRRPAGPRAANGAAPLSALNGRGEVEVWPRFEPQPCRCLATGAQGSPGSFGFSIRRDRGLGGC